MIPRAQVTRCAWCAVAQKRSHSDTMTARPRTSSVVERSVRRRTALPLRLFGHVRARVWIRARNATSGIPAHAGHSLCTVRRCAKAETFGHLWVRSRALVRWWKVVRGGALLLRCAGSDTFGHDRGIGHGTLLLEFPRTQVTGFLECAVAQRRKLSGISGCAAAH